MKEFYGILSNFFYSSNMLTKKEEGENISDYGQADEESKRSPKNSR